MHKMTKANVRNVLIPKLRNSGRYSAVDIRRNESREQSLFLRSLEVQVDEAHALSIIVPSFYSVCRMIPESNMSANQILETWEIHNRINLYVLEAIAPASLSDVSPAKGRNVGELFAHLHNVRLMWLKAAAPELLTGLEKVEKTDAGKKDLLRKSLIDSGKAIRTLVNNSLDSGGRVKGFKPHAVAFVGYLISHESHHRGQIVLLLKQGGHRLDNKILYGMWEWGVR